MRPAGRVLVLAAVAVVAVAVPALASTVVVGYLPPRVEYGVLAGDDAELANDEIRARGVVVDNLEPGAGPADTNAACPDAGCAYQLVVVDPAALRPADDQPPPAACATLDYGVVDPDPDVADVDGARLFTGRGVVPRHTVDGGDDQGSQRLSRGVGQLCFATPADAGGRPADAGDGPLAATQPVPVVILSNGAPPS